MKLILLAFATIFATAVQLHCMQPARLLGRTARLALNRTAIPATQLFSPSPNYVCAPTSHSVIREFSTKTSGSEPSKLENPTVPIANIANSEDFMELLFLMEECLRASSRPGVCKYIHKIRDLRQEIVTNGVTKKGLAQCLQIIIDSKMLQGVKLPKHNQNHILDEIWQAVRLWDDRQEAIEFIVMSIKYLVVAAAGYAGLFWLLGH